LNNFHAAGQGCSNGAFFQSSRQFQFHETEVVVRAPQLEPQAPQQETQAPLQNKEKKEIELRQVV